MGESRGRLKRGRGKKGKRERQPIGQDDLRFTLMSFIVIYLFYVPQKKYKYWICENPNRMTSYNLLKEKLNRVFTAHYRLQTSNFNNIIKAKELSKSSTWAQKVNQHSKKQ